MVQLSPEMTVRPRSQGVADPKKDREDRKVPEGAIAIDSGRGIYFCPKEPIDPKKDPEDPGISKESANSEKHPEGQKIQLIDPERGVYLCPKDNIDPTTKYLEDLGIYLQEVIVDREKHHKGRQDGRSTTEGKGN